MPEVQMPHWSAACSRNFCCSRFSLPPWAMPSIVPISWPSASAASIRQEQTSRPSTVIEQAPQSPVAQPSFEPVSPSSLRSASSMVLSGSHRNSIGSPLIVVVTCSFGILSVSLGAFRGNCRGALQEHAGDLGAVGDGAALVVDGTAGGAAGLGGSFESRIIQLRADQCFRGGFDQQRR